jgi:hypothetical protein
MDKAAALILVFGGDGQLAAHGDLPGSGAKSRDCAAQRCKALKVRPPVGMRGDRTLGERARPRQQTWRVQGRSIAACREWSAATEKSRLALNVLSNVQAMQASAMPWQCMIVQMRSRPTALHAPIHVSQLTADVDAAFGCTVGVDVDVMSATGSHVTALFQSVLTNRSDILNQPTTYARGRLICCRVAPSYRARRGHRHQRVAMRRSKLALDRPVAGLLVQGACHGPLIKSQSFEPCLLHNIHSRCASPRLSPCDSRVVADTHCA